MMTRIRTLALTVLVLSVGAAGCRSMFASSADDSSTTSSSSSGQMNTGSDGDASGYFVEGTNDVTGGGPAPTPQDQADVGRETQSHFRGIQIDPTLETSAGPKFVLPFDLDNDGLMDVVTGWNQSQPVQIHLQRRDANGKISFVTVTLAGTGPVAIIGDLDVADFDDDGWLDVAILVKETGAVGICPTPDAEEPFQVLDDAGMGEVQILFNPGNATDITNGDAWMEVELTQSYLPTRRDDDVPTSVTYPEANGYTGMAVGDFDGVNGADIVVAYNPPQCEFYGDDPSPVNRIVLYTNPGGGNTFAGNQWNPTTLEGDLPKVSDVKAMRVDLDGDLDLVFTYPDALTANVSWLRNPANESGAAAVTNAANWEVRPIGQVDTDANVLAIGDIDGDGFDDVLVRTNIGQAVQWFRHPGAEDGEPIFPPTDVLPTRFNFPWQVYTLSEYEIGRPAGMAIGDLTNDGLNDVTVAAGGVVYWYDGSLASSRYARWGELFVMDDTKENGTTDDPTDPDFVDDGTVIYGLTIVDLDGDGANDIIATFDRRTLSGLTDDTLLWFRNTILDDQTQGGN
ncbi:MAG TPA: FG-GAP-like repeat-containing protein [Phycisphaerae bacterium]|mgnify:CR=1 FL=1|nr:FG-GAP-like repeat-containing protein [Phycisphaerae bacterium]